MKFHKITCVAMYVLLLASFVPLSFLPWRGPWYALDGSLMAMGVAVSMALYYRMLRLDV